MKKVLKQGVNCAVLGFGLLTSSIAVADRMQTDSRSGLKVWAGTNKAYWFNLGNVIQIDQVFADSKLAQNNVDFANSAHVRRAHLIAQGGIGCHWEYRFGVNFATVNAPQWLPTYVQYNGIENSHIQVGVISQPISLAHWNADASVTTMERPMIAQAFIPHYGLGIYIDHAIEMLSFAAAVWEPHPSYKANDGTANSGSDDLGVSGRITFSPVHTADYVWHFGASGLYQKLQHNDTSTDHGFTIPLEMVGRHWPGFATTQLEAAFTPSKAWSTAGLEAAVLYGPFSIQAEYMETHVKAVPGNSNQHYSGWYALVAYTITGESKPYDQPTGTFAKVVPAGARGALEAFAQYSMLNLRDHLVGPIAHVATAGLNWYATQDVKLIAEYQRASYGRLNEGRAGRESSSSSALPLKREVKLYGLRFQADFSA